MNNVQLALLRTKERDNRTWVEKNHLYYIQSPTKILQLSKKSNMILFKKKDSIWRCWDMFLAYHDWHTLTYRDMYIYIYINQSIESGFWFLKILFMVYILYDL